MDEQGNVELMALVVGSAVWQVPAEGVFLTCGSALAGVYEEPDVLALKRLPGLQRDTYADDLLAHIVPMTHHAPRIAR
ncbi:MAG: hypothetical protein JNK55_20340 [Rubrivivax sp.]|nr:hypothetical protein [Rubrivivax sp.]